MKKILIPGIALGLVLLTAGFTTIPVQQATAVHTTITDAAGINVISSGAETIDDDGQIEVDCSQDFLLWEMFLDADIDDDTATWQIDSVEIDEIAIGTAGADATVTDVELVTAAATDAKQVVLNDAGGDLGDFSLPLFSDDDIDFEVASAAGDTDGDAVVIDVAVEGGGTCAVVTEAED